MQEKLLRRRKVIKSHLCARKGDHLDKMSNFGSDFRVLPDYLSPAGNQTENVAPSPGTLLALISPPTRVTNV